MHGRIRLQTHPDFQTVSVYGCNERPFVGLGRLLFHQRRQRDRDRAAHDQLRRTAELLKIAPAWLDEPSLAELRAITAVPLVNSR